MTGKTPTPYYVYNTSTGQITKSGICGRRDVAAQATEGETAVESAEMVDDKTHYNLGGELIERPILPSPDKTTISADGIDKATISPVPDPIAVEVDGQLYNISGGEVNFSSEDTGTYTVKIRHFPYVDYEVEIVVQ